MMTSVSKQFLRSPAQAVGTSDAIDDRLDPGFFKALADPTRAKMLACLMKCGRPCSVTEIAECCSVDFSVVSRHLGLLARAGLVEGEKRGRTVWYSARCSAISDRLRSIATAIDEWCPSCGGDSDGPGCPCPPRGESARVDVMTINGISGTERGA
jgi:ArsR family transcriptional regulator